MFAWPADGKLVVPGLKATVRSARLLAGGTLVAQTAGEDLVLRLPSRAPDPIATVIAVTLERPPMPSR